MDGVHFDDYFYPYREKGMDFPDAASWKKYVSTVAQGGMSRSDWRRENVSGFVRARP